MPIDPNNGIYPSPEEVKVNIHAKLTTKHAELITTQLYLGNPKFWRTVNTMVSWTRVGRENILCTKTSADAFEAEMN